MGFTESNHKPSDTAGDKEDDSPMVIKWKEVDESTPLPKFCQTLLKGKKIAAVADDCNEPPSSVDWVDRDLLHRGQKVLRDNLTLLIFPMFLLLAVTTYIPSLFRTIYHSGRTPQNTKNFSFKRLMKTSMDLVSWFETDFLNPETPAYKNMKKARFLHRAFFRRFNESKRDFFNDKFSKDNLNDLSKREATSVRLLAVIEKDLESQMKAPKIQLGPPEDPEALYVNQLEVACVGAVALGFMLSKGPLCGIDTVEKKRAVIYFYRVMQYSIGLHDEFNSAIGDIEEVQQKLSDMLVFLMGPHIRSPNVTVRRHFAVTVMNRPWHYLVMADCLQVELPSLWAKAGWSDRLSYRVFNFLYTLANMSRLARKALDWTFKRLQNKYMSDISRYN